MYCNKNYIKIRTDFFITFSSGVQCLFIFKHCIRSFIISIFISVLYYLLFSQLKSISQQHITIKCKKIC